MSQILVDQSVLSKVTDYVSATSQKLEKSAALEAGFNKFAQHIVDSMVKAGQLRAENKAAALAELQADPFNKAAAAFDFVLSGTYQAAPRMGKSASAEPVASAGLKQSDRAWLAGNGVAV